MSGEQPTGTDGQQALGGPWAGGAPALTRGFFHQLGRCELWLAQAAVVVMTALVLTSAISRTFGKPQSWAVDLATFSFAWAVFVGADVALRQGKMVTIDVVTERLNDRTRVWLDLLNTVLIVVFLVAMVGLGLWLSWTTRERSFSGLPWLSYSWVTLSVPVGCALMLYTTVRTFPARLLAIKGDRP